MEINGFVVDSFLQELAEALTVTFPKYLFIYFEVYRERKKGIPSAILPRSDCSSQHWVSLKPRAPAGSHTGVGPKLFDQAVSRELEQQGRRRRRLRLHPLCRQAEPKETCFDAQMKLVLEPSSMSTSV